MIATTYEHVNDTHRRSHKCLLPIVERIVMQTKPSRIFDLGCGNGSVANRLSRYATVTGVDASQSGVEIANKSYPHLTIRLGSAYDDLAAQYGTFPLVVSLEVVEHLYDPRAFAKTLFDMVAPGGLAVVSTPYHGYLKNLALALTGRLDQHFTALWDGGHIKFFSVRTLGTLLREAGFESVEFEFCGRVRWLARSMIAVGRRAR